MLTANMFFSYSKVFHQPGSGGVLNLPFQRPIESCRKFTSQVIESVISNITSKVSKVKEQIGYSHQQIVNLDLARLFANAYPNTLDTTIQSTACLDPSADDCLPLSFVITGDINAMWLRDSANQLMAYVDYLQHDIRLKKLFLGTIYLQANFINIDPYSNAFNQPQSMEALANGTLSNRDLTQSESVYERKWEIDSLASFLSLSYRYWQTTGDDSFMHQTVWIDAVDAILNTLKKEQEPTFNLTSGEPLETDYEFKQTTDRPTENQFIDGRGQPVAYTGMVKSLFRPSDDATVFTYFIPGNAMMSVELNHLSEMLISSRLNRTEMANEAARLSKEIRDGIYAHGIINHTTFGQVFAYEVDGYGSSLIMDDANVPSLLSLSLIGFLEQNDTIYQNTRRLVWSKHNPYFFSGPRGSGIGGPHVGLSYEWPMSQIVRILSSSDDDEIREGLSSVLSSTDNTGLIHESINVYKQNGGDGNSGYTRPWFAWANGLFGQAILKIANERPYLIF
ncbi:hypothetical protein G6F64_009582 [Rhizopus arrhizus]|uniref:Glycoside hydrolase family 125 protein n=1 Tax=Rhizopus oryzae TaxID=64495 RepID=A0A9P6X2X3_RHIOR|nr:hypothetical protein G6F64_009582 [Rhizopus arrhizus]